MSKLNLDSIVKAFEDFNYDRSTEALLCHPHANDPCQIGQLLKEKDYVSLDGLVPAGITDMTPFRKVFPLVSRLFNSKIVLDNKKGYEIVFIVDLFNGIDRIQVNCLENLLPLTTSGGFLCWTMPNLRKLSSRDPGQFAGGDFDRYISSLCDKCKWLSVLSYPRSIPNYATDEDDTLIEGVFYAMQVV